MGCFDPYSDDPRLGIQKVALCKYTAQMVVAGTAGQVWLVFPDVAIGRLSAGGGPEGCDEVEGNQYGQ